MTFNCFASCAFGLESVTALELKRLGLDDVSASDARVYFKADAEGLARANIFLRTADRVYIELHTFVAKTFETLFDGIAALPWEDYISKNAAFPVDADSVKSRLFSVSDIQKISKKAIVKRLMDKHKTSKLPESGSRYNVHIKVLKDHVSVCLNVSGQGLNRRGYRVSNVKAPIRETLAAGLVMLSGWRDGAFCDPMCGSGTIAIEAAMIGAGMAPGIKRSFDGEHWHFFKDEWQQARDEAKQLQKATCEVYASDIDKKAVSAASKNAAAAGVDLKIYHADVHDFKRHGCIVVTNPPYAQRLGEQNEVHQLYRNMGQALKETKRKYIITADEEFERWFGKRASKRRKLYNGNIRCTFYQYF